MFNKFCRWLDSNHRPLELEATSLPTEPQPLSLVSFAFYLYNLRGVINELRSLRTPASKIT